MVTSDRVVCVLNLKTGAGKSSKMEVDVHSNLYHPLLPVYSYTTQTTD